MRLPLRLLLPVLIMAGGLVAAFLAGMTSLKIVESRSNQYVDSILTLVGNQASADVAAGIREGERRRVRGAIEQLQVVRRLQSAALVDGNNRITESTRRELFGKTIGGPVLPLAEAIVDDARRLGAPQRTIADGLLYFASPVGALDTQTAAAPEREYVLLLIYNYATVVAEGRVEATNVALVTGGSIFLLSLVLWIVLERRLLGRIQSLVDVSRRIGSGQLKEPLEISGSDEVTTLARALENMRANLHRNREELRHYADQLASANATIEAERLSLADRVAERTRRLTEANAELKQARDDAEEASRAKSAFLATISHEIRTPMNGVLGAMELLGRTGLDDERASLLDTAETSARSLLGLLNDVLDMAKIEAGRIDVVPAPADIRGIVSHVIATHAPVATTHGTQITSEIADDVPEWVMVDALRLQQVLGNVVSNSAKFTRDGHIVVKLAAEDLEDDVVRLTFIVQDDGRGISPQSIDKIFNPFEQGSGRFARTTGGTGLGLAISRGLVERMGGGIAIESEPGVGTVVTATVTVERASRPAARTADTDDTQETAILALLSDNASRGEARLRALVVDDHPVNRLLQSRQLDQLGIDAECAADGVDALQRIRESRFDLVITDCEMPNMDGFELATAIRSADAGWRHMPIIGCTAHALPEVAAYCRECGMNEVLTKPMRLDELAMALRKAIPSANTGSVPIELTELGNDNDVINEEQLDQLTNGDKALRHSLLESFLTDHDKAVADIRRAAEADDMATCRSLAHRSKGACGVFGAGALRDTFEMLEKLAAQDSPGMDQLASVIRQLEEEGTRLRRAVEAMNTPR